MTKHSPSPIRTPEKRKGSEASPDRIDSSIPAALLHAPFTFEAEAWRIALGDYAVFEPHEPEAFRFTRAVANDNVMIAKPATMKPSDRPPSPAAPALRAEVA